MNVYLCLNLGEKFKFRWFIGRRSASYETVAHRSYSRVCRLSKYGLEVSIASEGARFSSFKLFLLSERLC